MTLPRGVRGKVRIWWRDPPDPDGTIWPASIEMKYRDKLGRSVTLDLHPNSLVDVDEAALLIGKSHVTVHQMVKDRTLRVAKREGKRGRLLFRVRDLKPFLPRAKPGQIWLRG